jgi:hypothetical protein
MCSYAVYITSEEEVTPKVTANDIQLLVTHILAVRLLINPNNIIRTSNLPRKQKRKLNLDTLLLWEPFFIVIHK